MNRHSKTRWGLLVLFAFSSLGIASGQQFPTSPSAGEARILLETSFPVPALVRSTPAEKAALLAQAPAPALGVQRPSLNIQRQVAPTAVTPAPQIAPGSLISTLIVIRSPDASTKWETGDRVTISWQTLNLPAQDYLSVELMNYTGTSRIEYLGNSNTGSLEWTIPASIYKWPGNHRIRVATLDNKVEKVSDMFHIGLKTAQKTVTIKADTVNKFKLRTRSPSNAVSNFFGAGSQFAEDLPTPTADPGSHKMRVGFERRRKDSVDYSWIYRSHVKTNVYAHRNEGFLVKATLRYPRLSGDVIDERFCVLTAPWDGQAGTLFTVPCDIERIGPNSHDVTAHVRKWLTYPDSNYGFLFFGRDESLGFDTQYRGVATYGDMTLVLEFQSAQ
jgi:hypothetical protein